MPGLACNLTALSTRPTILIADSRKDLLDTLSAYLEQAGCDVLTATDGLAAFRYLEEKHPDLIILDLDLPGLSGFRLVQLARRGNALPHPAIVVMTAHSVEEVRDVMASGVEAFVEKPCRPEDLLSAVHFCLVEKFIATAKPFVRVRIGGQGGNK